MIARPFGPTGVELPVMGQGTWRMEDTRAASIAALRRGVDLGLTLIDTAEMYGGGQVEALVGEALGDRRDELYLVSKVLPSNASRDGVVAACERSLGFLGTDHLDCYLLHWPGAHALEDTLAGFEALVADGRIRSWGVSNFDVDELRALLEIAGEGRVATNQLLYHLRERAIEHRELPFCREHGIAVMAYSPLGQGDFPREGEAQRAVLAEVGAPHGLSPEATALARLAAEDGVFVIPKSSRLEGVEANARAGQVRLSADECARIDAAFPRGPQRRGVPML